MALDNTVSQLFSLASSALSSAREVSGRIGGTTPTINISGLDYSVAKTASSRPTALSDLLSGDNSPATLRLLDSEAEKWLDKFFPELQGSLKTTPEQWASGILTGEAPFGLSQEVFEAIWHEGRDREQRSRNSSSQQLRADFSMRGFGMPPGSFFDAMRRNEEASADAISAVNRAQIIRDSEIKLDLVKFAEDSAIRLKMGIMQSLASFYQQWVEIPNKDIQAAQLKVQAYASLNSALASYQQVELGWENLRLNAAQARLTGNIEAGRIKASLASGDTRNSGLGTAARAFGDAAGSAASAAGTLQADITSGGGS